MKNVKALLIVSFLMVLCAGVVIGSNVRESGRHRHRGPAFLAEELGLTTDQQDQMREIWSGVREKTRDFPSEDRRKLSEERDLAIRELLTEEQVSDFEEIQANYESEKEKLLVTWKAPYEEAMAKTREVLNEDQLEKFEDLREKRWRNGRGNHRGKRDRQNENGNTED